MNRVHILQEALEALDDLNDGFFFYESQESGLGDYFSACLQGDIEGLKISAGTHRIVYRDYHRLLSRIFPTESSTPSKRIRLSCGPSSISVEIPPGFETTCSSSGFSTLSLDRFKILEPNRLRFKSKLASENILLVCGKSPAILRKSLIIIRRRSRSYCRTG